MSKIIILSINAKFVHSSLAAWFLAEGISKYACLSHDVKVVETTINQQNDYIAEQVIIHKPDVVGISSYIWNADKLPDILRLLRQKLPDAVFVLGGPEATHNPEYWLNSGAGFVIRGEGEQSFPALIDALQADLTTDSISGLCRRQNNQIYINPLTERDDAFVNPYSDAYFAALKGRIAYIETSRGCPYRCAFCLSGTSEIRFFPLDKAKEQLYKLSKSGAQTVKLVDRTFNCNSERACELFSYIIGLNSDCCFHFEVAADLFDERTLALLSTAPPGRIQLEAGLQSFFEPALKASSRHMDLTRAEKNIRTLLSGRNIHIHVDLIAGLPFETLSDFQNSFDRAYALGAHTLQLGFLKLLHGSALREQFKSIKCTEKPPYEIISSPWLSAEDLKIIKQTENALQHTYNKGRFLSTLRYAISASGLRPFLFYRILGENVTSHGIQLAQYAEQIYNCCIKMSGVNIEELRDCMVIDWLSTVKGVNMPHFLRGGDKRRKQVAAEAERRFGRSIGRGEAAVLHSGKGAFVDSQSRDPVTKLYQVHFTDIKSDETHIR